MSTFTLSSATFCLYPAITDCATDTAANEVSVDWDTVSNDLVVTRSATTVDDATSPPGISVSLTVDGVVYNNIITSLTITECDSACSSCDPANLSIDSSVDSADWITE